MKRRVPPLTDTEAYLLLTTGVERRRLDAVFNTLVGVWTWHHAGSVYETDRMILEHPARHGYQVREHERVLRGIDAARTRLLYLEDTESLRALDAALVAAALERMP